MFILNYIQQYILIYIFKFCSLSVLWQLCNINTNTAFHSPHPPSIYIPLGHSLLNTLNEYLYMQNMLFLPSTSRDARRNTARESKSLIYASNSKQSSFSKRHREASTQNNSCLWSDIQQELRHAKLSSFQKGRGKICFRDKNILSESEFAKKYNAVRKCNFKQKSSWKNRYFMYSYVDSTQ